MTRLAVLLAVLTLAAAPAAALAQNDPFSPLPQPAPTVAPTPEPQGGGDLSFTRATLILIGLGVLGAFGGVIWWITRDARRNLTEEDRRAVDRERAGEPGERKVSAQAKKKARQKAKAQRAARRRNR